MRRGRKSNQCHISIMVRGSHEKQAKQCGGNRQGWCEKWQLKTLAKTTSELNIKNLQLTYVVRGEEYVTDRAMWWQS